MARLFAQIRSMKYVAIAVIFVLVIFTVLGGFAHAQPVAKPSRCPLCFKGSQEMNAQSPGLSLEAGYGFADPSSPM